MGVATWGYLGERVRVGWLAGKAGGSALWVLVGFG